MGRGELSLAILVTNAWLGDFIEMNARAKDVSTYEILPI